MTDNSGAPPGHANQNSQGAFMASYAAQEEPSLFVRHRRFERRHPVPGHARHEARM